MPLGDDPVLDAQPLAAVGVGPAGDVAGRVNAGHAGFEVFTLHSRQLVDQVAFVVLPEMVLIFGMAWSNSTGGLSAQ